MPDCRITVLSVSWRSTALLREMFTGLRALADAPDTLQLLIADNTFGADDELKTLDFPQLEIVPVDVQGEVMSMAHAVGLNTLLPRVDTPYVLIADPDVAILRVGWDHAFCAALEEGGHVALGAPYPGWKLGKYHDFPSPPFALWRTDALRDLEPDWRPYGRTTARRLTDFALRQLFWMPRVIDRYFLRLPRRQFRVGRWAERAIGVVSKDTGWEIAQRARRRGWHADVFDVVFDLNRVDDIPRAQRAQYHALALEFELYAWQGRPVLTHRNPTLTRLDFNLWTNKNVLIFQDAEDKAAQTARWQQLVAEILPDIISNR